MLCAVLLLRLCGRSGTRTVRSYATGSTRARHVACRRASTTATSGSANSHGRGRARGAITRSAGVRGGGAGAWIRLHATGRNATSRAGISGVGGSATVGLNRIVDTLQHTVHSPRVLLVTALLGRVTRRRRRSRRCPGTITRVTGGLQSCVLRGKTSTLAGRRPGPIRPIGVSTPANAHLRIQDRLRGTRAIRSITTRCGLPDGWAIRLRLLAGAIRLQRIARNTCTVLIHTNVAHPAALVRIGRPMPFAKATSAVIAINHHTRIRSSSVRSTSRHRRVAGEIPRPPKMTVRAIRRLSTSQT
ncbi:hypothetical protein R77560_03806 [Ralstonia thomasii]|uniref:Uncharacterized protein n=1 Tax=Ralstonia thomasii TaxID=3058596 RepID=A0AAD2F5G6_9RALS|nr:hypothetical protein R77560_03806 [Ralstonia sp. LMG 18095]